MLGHRYDEVPDVLSKQLRSVSRKLSKKVDNLRFAPPVHYVYNPLVYARQSHELYLEQASSGCEVLLLGMNPGPWGMVQTGVPFGEVTLVRDWMGIVAAIGKPPKEHPKRLVVGFDCHRSEVSGRRLWGWARDHFGTADAFFSRFFVWNYCPLAFLESSGRNRTPDKLVLTERRELYELCDQALLKIVALLKPRFVVGVGSFSERRIKLTVSAGDVVCGGVLHPSPASPKANRGWARQMSQQLVSLGVRL